MEVKRQSERETMEPEKENQSPVEEDTFLKEMLRVDEKYLPLLTLLEHFTLREESMQYYIKLRHFENNVHDMCPSETHLNQAFATLRAAALVDSKTALKLAAVGASFTSEPRQQRLRAALLSVVMQGTFSKLDALKQTNPTFIINAANLMGDYFAFAQIFSNNHLEVLATPLLQYMRALLGIGDIRAHRCLTSQLQKNGRVLQLLLPQELAELTSLLRRDAARG